MPRLNSPWRLSLQWLLVALLVPLAALWLDQSAVMRHLDGALRDRLLHAMAVPPSGQVALVVVDRKSLDELGPWPWKHAVHAQLLRQLARHQPRAVVLDLPLDQPAPWMDAPQPLAEAMAGLPVYLVRHAVLADPKVRNAQNAQWRTHPPALVQAAAGVGHMRLVRDLDAVARTVYAYEGPPGAPLPYVGLLLADADVRQAHARWRPAPGADAGARGWLRKGPIGFPPAISAGQFRTFSYVDVLRGNVPAGALAGRDLMVGLGPDAELSDLWRASTVGPPWRMTKVELHANAIEALRTGRTVHAFMGWCAVLWVVVPVLLGLLGYLRWERHSALGGVAMALLCIVGSIALLDHGYWVSPVAPVLGLMLGYGVCSWRRQSLVFGYFRRTLARLEHFVRAQDDPPPTRRRILDAAEEYTEKLSATVDRLEAVQALFRQSLSDLPVAVLLCGEDGTIHHANPAARRLLHLQRLRDAQGRTVAQRLPMLLEAMHDPKAPPLRQGHWADVHQRMVYHHAGQVFRVRCVPLQRRARGWAVVLDDLTAARQLEAERAQWLRFLSHDLRSPQANILGHVALAERKHPDAPGRAELACAVRREVARTLALADGFMDLSQAEAGHFSQEEVLIGAVAGDAADQVWAYAGSRGVQVQLQVWSDGELFVRGNAELLKRAVVNLLNNAIRHSRENASVLLCVGAGDGEVLLCVSDEGEGMDAEQVCRLLRREPAAPPPPRGAPASPAKAAAPLRSHGVGLAVVWAVVERHGGWIDLWSMPGQGSSFLIGLPQLVVDEGPLS
ncbi:CHASE2 and HATPase_c domain-containing protein [Xenophilus arseniciresistens]|uniref:histidine kinase n=1 Tax=Xenophilus arseniciresistens TaxID=1283306 RepID=A0AAE3NEZ6_9BURK|nr:CHASE2 and HATPase_c domain-containing protein [Xenophilus arseniciresistens]MDA7419067.1 CHASE2 and HATPase_c domain-containing protein [Xenophilus arseniciresistens]